MLARNIERLADVATERLLAQARGQIDDVGG